MSLPAWAQKEMLLCDCAGCEYAIHMSDALSIAWAALKPLAVASSEVRNAMRRIEEMK